MDVDVNEGNIMGGRAGEPRRSSVLEKKNKSNFRRTTDLKKKKIINFCQLKKNKYYFRTSWEILPIKKK